VTDHPESTGWQAPDLEYHRPWYAWAGIAVVVAIAIGLVALAIFEIDVLILAGAMSL
jgi:hypothetical protein